jgi:hypothetical protein
MAIAFSPTPIISGNAAVHLWNRSGFVALELVCEVAVGLGLAALDAVAGGAAADAGAGLLAGTTFAMTFGADALVAAATGGAAIEGETLA